MDRPAEKEENSTNWMIMFMMGLTYAISQTLKVVNNSLQQQVLWTILFIIVSKSMYSQRASFNSAVQLQERNTQLDLAFELLHQFNENQLWIGKPPFIQSKKDHIKGTPDADSETRKH